MNLASLVRGRSGSKSRGFTPTQLTLEEMEERITPATLTTNVNVIFAGISYNTNLATNDNIAVGNVNTVAQEAATAASLAVDLSLLPNPYAVAIDVQANLTAASTGTAQLLQDFSATNKNWLTIAGDVTSVTGNITETVGAIASLNRALHDANATDQQILQSARTPIKFRMHLSVLFIFGILWIACSCPHASAQDYQKDDLDNLKTILKQGYRIYQRGDNRTIPTVTARLIQQGVHAKTVGVRKWNGLDHMYSDIDWFVLVPGKKR